MSTIFDKLEPVIQRYHEIEESMGDPEVAANFERIQELARERASLETLVKISSVYKELVGEIEDLESLLKEGSDLELIEMAKAQGVHLVACTMSMEIMGIKREELIEGIEEGGVASYLGSAEKADVNLFI